MQIKDMIIKTLCSGQPTLRHFYNAAQPNNHANNMCFEILGVDVMLNEKMKPFLLEINHSPSFTTDTPLDTYLKQNLIQDALVLLNINAETKQQIMLSLFN